MKLLLVCVGLVLSGMLFYSTGNKVINQKTNSPELEQVVKGFWTNIQNSDNSKLAEFLREVPKDFNENCLRDQKNDLKNTDRLFISNSQNVVSENSSDNFVLDNSFRQTIINFMERKYSLHEIQNIVQNGNEAIVTISYGSEEFTVSNDNMLLRKEDGKWKVFMIVPTSVLNEVIPYSYFAKKPSCQ